jgi:SAM-dependent methyltransferase
LRGAGYGSALLAKHAGEVVGADIAADAIALARSRYADISNLEFVAADCAALPFPDASFDAVVSFETIEHISRQEAFLDEVRRVLRADRLFILSSPNKLEYSDRRGFANEFHVRELYRDELTALLTPRFSHQRWFGQRMSFFSVVWPEEKATEGELFEVSEASAAHSSTGHALPRSRQATWRPRKDCHRSFRADAPCGAEHAAERARLAQQIDAQAHEIERRASVRWWLALPWRRVMTALRRA